MKKETYFVRKHNNCSAFDSGGTRKKYSPLECNCGASLYNDACAQREIKFRAWDEENGMFPVTDFHWDKGGKLYDNGHKLMQFTGLLDKNGKEIYEGDILLVFDEAKVPITDDGQGPIEECNHLVRVDMKNGVCGFEIPKSDDGETGWYGLHYWKEEISSDGYEIIGNIYENPELLK